MSSFKPAWWLSNPHLQTLYPALMRKPQPLPRVRERLRLRDGDWLYLDWRLPAHWVESDKPLVIVIHGLTGCSASQYVIGQQVALDTMGWASVAMNCRGATGELNDSVRAYHAGAFDDVADVVAAVAARYPQKKLAIVGFSLGGAITLNYLAREALPANLKAAVAVSVPLDLGACSDRLDQGFSRVYRRHLLTSLQQTWRRKSLHLEKVGQAQTARFIRQRLERGPYKSFRVFDNELIAGLHGFRDGDDYYACCSPLQVLPDITLPTLLLQAEDDPFLAPVCFPKPSQASAKLTIEITPKGGHVGFVEQGSSVREPGYYLERRIPQFLEKALLA